jgi:hypothetical protein
MDSYKINDIPPLKEKLSPPIYTLDEHGNLYLGKYGKSTVWVHRIGSKDWTRREVRYGKDVHLRYLNFACVKRNKLYAYCYAFAVSDHRLISIDLETGDVLLLKKQRQAFMWHEIWKDEELRVFYYEDDTGKPFDTRNILCYGAFHLTDFTWTTRRVLEGIDGFSDRVTCVRDDDFIYVRSTRGVKRYREKEGNYDWIYETDTCESPLYHFFQIGDYLCFLESNVLVALSKSGNEVHKIPCPIESYSIACVGKRIYFLKIDHGLVKLAYSQLTCFSLQSIVVGHLQKYLKPETTREELFLVIGRLSSLVM